MWLKLQALKRKIILDHLSVPSANLITWILKSGESFFLFPSWGQRDWRWKKGHREVIRLALEMEEEGHKPRTLGSL